jgi:hypothetical protein
MLASAKIRYEVLEHILHCRDSRPCDLGCLCEFLTTVERFTRSAGCSTEQRP